MKEEYSITIRGTATLLHHKFVFVDKKKPGSSYIPEEEAETHSYRDEKGKLVQPANHIEGSMFKAAVEFKMVGKKTFKDAFKGGVFVEPNLILHKNQKHSVLTVPAVVQRARIARSRYEFPIGWELSFTITVIDERITGEILKAVLTEAGKYRGIGDDRPRHGRFEIVSFEKIRD